MGLGIKLRVRGPAYGHGVDLEYHLEEGHANSKDR